MTGIIEIKGQIGSTSDQKGVELIDVITAVSKLPADTKILQVNIEGPGGIVDVGNAIYDYLDSLKKQYTVNTVQTGLLASIDTKIWMVGQDRKRNPKYGFIIHNPWMNITGDSKQIAQELEGLIKAEDDLRKFYMKATGLNAEALAPLMDIETNLTAQQCLDLKFATSLTNQIPVMAKVDDNKLTFGQRIDKILASIKGEEKPKAMELPLADGSMLTSDAQNPESLVGSAIMKEGAPAPDGEYQMPDGSVLKVTGGKAESLTPKMEDKTQVEGRVAAIEAGLLKVTETLQALLDASKNGIKAAVEETESKLLRDFEGKIVALKSEIGTTHVPKPAATVYSDKVAKDKSGFRTISEVMAQKQEERKNRK